MIERTSRAVRNRFLIERRRIARATAAHSLKKNATLWSGLQEYAVKSSSTGCNEPDYWHLYRHIRSHKPTEVLECGTGISTFVIALALSDNEAEGYPAGRATSMEEHEHWLEQSSTLLPRYSAP